MRIRVIHCEDPEHASTWLKAEDCPHWSMTCPRARKAKKPRHKLTRGEAGFAVDITAIAPEGWPYDYPPTSEALELSTKRYTGRWGGPDASVWEPAPRGNLITCATGCGLKGAL